MVIILQLNVTTDYGIRTVLYLSIKGGVVSSKEMCEKMGIPHTYMHKITKALKDAKIISEKRGTTGGFILEKDPETLSILNIITAFEKTMYINRCLEEDKYCSRNAAAFCKIREFYTKLQEEMNNKLDIKISTFLK